VFKLLPEHWGEPITLAWGTWKTQCSLCRTQAVQRLFNRDGGLQLGLEANVHKTRLERTLAAELHAVEPARSVHDLHPPACHLSTHKISVCKRCKVLNPVHNSTRGTKNGLRHRLVPYRKRS
jgi:hypothetical protein